MVQMEPPPRVSNVYRMCVKCNVHLCVAHFQPYHDQGDDNSIHSSTIDDEIGETDQVLKKLLFYSLLEPTENLHEIMNLTGSLTCL